MTTWGRTWAVVLAAVCLLMGAWEVVLRRSGFPPVGDDVAAWVFVRQSVGARDMVLAGSSRIQSDLDPVAWAAATGGAPPRQLGVAASSGLPVLEDLAADTGFAGVVVLDALARGLYLPRAEEHVSGLLRAYHELADSPARRWELGLQQQVPPLAFRSRGAAPRRFLIEALRRRRLPDRPYMRTLPNRYRPLDFTVSDSLGLERRAVFMLGRFRAPTRPEADAAERRIQRLVAAIRARGGDVVLLRLPRTRGVRAAEERVFDSRRFWDGLGGRVGAAAVDAELLVPGWPSLPDGSHLDQRDVPRLTRLVALAVRDSLRARGTWR